MISSPDLERLLATPSRGHVVGHETQLVSEGWQATASSPDLELALADLDSLRWTPARVPGTAAGAMRDSGSWRPGDAHDFDREDWWFRTTFTASPAAAGEEVVLRLDGIATVSEVHLNGELVSKGESMFERRCVAVGGLLRGTNELVISCRALEPLLGAPRRPRARWRTRIVANGNLRFFRTMMLGRAPGFAPGPAAVGPWRGVSLERRRGVVVEQLALRPRVSGSDGRVSVRARVRALAGEELQSAHAELAGPTGSHTVELELVRAPGDIVEAHGELTVAEVARWWPHTHGEPSLYEARLQLLGTGGAHTVNAGRVGFRSLAAGPLQDHDVERDGLDIHVNGVRVFARGAVWTPIDAVGMAPSGAELRRALEQVRDAGMNLLRIPGTSAYEEPAFHDLCDELGVMVWQDLMFANLDYPIADPGFRTTVEREVGEVMGALAGRASLAVVCANSEVEQQVAMLGLDPALGRGELFGELVPRLVRESDADAIYVPSAPCGGELPFRPDRGIANYYGVGAYRRPLEDARRAEVRFAAECLAFSNVPDEAAIEELLPDAPADVVVHHPRWKAGVPRDAGSGWDFEDVRDHYLGTLYGLDPAELRRVEHERYLELSRALTGEIMAEVFGEWRRAASPCAGGLVLWLRDLVPGAGWGLVDHRGEPKAAYHHLRRALLPIAVWMTDEGLGGVHVHVANDRAAPLRAHLRVALYRDFEHGVGEVSEIIELAGHSVREWDLEAMLGRFVDAGWAYRFGPPQQDLIVASLERVDSDRPELLSQAARFPAAHPLTREAGDRLGIAATAVRGDDDEGDGRVQVRVRARRFAYGVRVHAPGFTAGEDSFNVEPGGERELVLRPRAEDSRFAGAWLTAVNLSGRVSVEDRSRSLR